MQPNGNSDTPSPTDHKVTPLNVTKGAENTPQTFKGIGLLAPSELAPGKPSFNMLCPPENEQQMNHLASTIKFPAAPETGEFDSDGLFEESINDRDSPTVKAGGE